MSPLNIGFFEFGIFFILLFVLLFSGMYIGIAMALVGFAGLVYLRGFTSALGELTTVPYTTFAHYDFSVIPLFILMGEFFYHAKMSADIYDTTYKWLGQLRGGLAMATVGACAAFAAVSGSSIATAVTMGMVALPEMKRYKYDPAMATGCLAAGGGIGILIPPSIAFILYGIITGTSIGALFLSGFFPGVLQAVLFMATIWVLCQFNHQMGPPGPRTSFKEKVISLKNTWIVLILFVLVLGSLYLGVATPTEAGGIGAFGAFAFALASRRLGWQGFKSSLLETVKSAGMLMVVLLGAIILSHFLAVTRIPFVLADLIVELQMNRYIILAIILFLYLILGMFLDPSSMLLITLPTLFPVVVALGFDPIWFGVIVVVMVEVGLITPPVGLNVFVIHGVAKDVPMYTIFRGIIPFLVADAVLLAILISFPQVSLFLPNMMR